MTAITEIWIEARPGHGSASALSAAVRRKLRAFARLHRLNRRRLLLARLEAGEPGLANGDWLIGVARALLPRC